MAESSKNPAADGASIDSTTASQPPYGSLISQMRTTDFQKFQSIARTLNPSLSRRTKRILLELSRLHASTSTLYLSISPLSETLDSCLACMEGPPDTPYAGGIFYLHIRYPEEYPMAPMQVRFMTPIWHPNIDEMGRICLDVFERGPGGWSPCCILETALLMILARLSDPVVEDAVNTESASLFKDNIETFCTVAKMHTEEHATGVKPETEGLEDFWGSGECLWYAEDL